MKVKISEVYHPLQDCQQELSSLLDEIIERKENMYQVPYQELNEIHVNLDPNPDIDIALFNENYAYVQSYHNRVCKILIDIKKEYKEWQLYLNRARKLYRKAKNNILVNEKSIQSLKNKELQEATVQESIPDLTDLIDDLETIVNDLKLEIDIVELKKDLLDKANTNINRQQKVVEDELTLHYPVGVRIKLKDKSVV